MNEQEEAFLYTKSMKDNDPVNHPSHYTQGKYEVIDVLEDWKLDFRLSNAVKYIARAKYKGNEVQDLEKAVWYIKRYIEKTQEVPRAPSAS